MNVLKLVITALVGVAISGCVAVPPDGDGVGGFSSLLGSAYTTAPPDQVYIADPPPPPPAHHQRFCRDHESGEYLEVRPNSKRCREWLYEKQKEREHHKHRPRPPKRDEQPLCIDSRTGRPVQGVAANSPQCAKINNHPPINHRPPAQPTQPEPIKQRPPAQPISQPAACIDGSTGRPVQGVAANSPQCAKINSGAFTKQPPPQQALCIDKSTGKPVNGVPANSPQCAKINH